MFGGQSNHEDISSLGNHGFTTTDKSQVSTLVIFTERGVELSIAGRWWAWRGDPIGVNYNICTLKWTTCMRLTPVARHARSSNNFCLI
jgi:hypothetical protein